MLVSDELVAQLPAQTRFESELEVLSPPSVGVHVLLRRLD